MPKREKMGPRGYPESWEAVLQEAVARYRAKPLEERVANLTYVYDLLKESYARRTLGDDTGTLEDHSVPETQVERAAGTAG